ncbi:MAG: Na/Pi cotransporter family protein [Planctomycetaceae bacterium]
MSMWVTLLGGLALFLYGLDLLTSALKVISGERLKSILAKLTSNRFTAVLAGMFVTSIVQSSSVTTVLVVGFISAGLMELTQAIGVIMGAEIGTTVTAQIIAFKVTKAALALVAAGFTIRFVAKRERLRQFGTMLFGLGLVFYGMNVMSDATDPLRDYPPFIEAAQHLDSAFLAILLSAIFTAIIQSSSATTVLIIVLAGQGLITLDQAIPLVFGANIGTCVTALLAAIGKPREAVRAALVHIVFNTLGVMLWFGFIGQLAWLVSQMSSETTRQIAHAHTVFNVTNTCVFIWFTHPLARLVTWLVPERPEAAPQPALPKYLDTILLQTPSLAMDSVRRELGHLGEITLTMVRGAMTGAIHGTKQELEDLAKMDDDVDALHGEIVTYLGQLSQQTSSDKESSRLHDYLLMANYFESVGDLVSVNVVPTGHARRHAKLVVSPETEDHLQAIHHKVCWALELAVQALTNEDTELASQVAEAKSAVNALVEEAERHLSRRLTATAPNRLVAYRTESELMEYLKRVYYFAKRIARLAAHNDKQETTAMPEPTSEEPGETEVATNVTDDI